MNDLRPLARLVFLVLACSALCSTAGADHQQAVQDFLDGRLDKACGEFQSLVDQSPAYEFGHYMLGLCGLERDRLDEALRHLETAVELDGERVEYRIGLADAYERLKRPADALAVLDPVEPRVTSDTRYKFHSTRGYAHVALKQWEPAVDDLAAAHDARPKRKRVLDQLTLSLFNVRRYDEAADHARRLRTLDVRSATGARVLAEALLRLDPPADTKKETFYGEAVDAAGTFLALHPGDAGALNLLGRTELAAGRFEEAVAHFGEVVAHDPQSCPARVNQGKAWIGLKRWEEAAKALEEARSCAPDSVPLLQTLGMVYRIQQRLEDSLAVYERAYQLNPSPAIAKAIEEVNYNIEARALNAAADEEDRRFREEQERLERERREMKEKIARWNQVTRDE
jgi:tetratricopeptide (TPR) repeat protein